MRNFRRHLTYAWIGSITALPLGCFIGGLAFGVWGYSSGAVGGFWLNVGLAVTIGLFAILFGIIPTFLYGAPAYALFASRFRPSLLSAIFIAAVPSLLLIPLSTDLSGAFVIFGFLVASSLHFIAGPRMRRLDSDGPKNSFKPTSGI